MNGAATRPSERMATILYIVPYFGRFPGIFPAWLHSCGNNPTVDWLILTDDERPFNYPPNVRTVYTTFEAVRERMQKLFDYPISLEKPYKLCDYKVVYGAAFPEYVAGYDFWGFCDIDLIWGDIRRFLTPEVLGRYEKIGYQGHSTLFRNNGRNNSIFRERMGEESIRPLLQSPEAGFTDEDFIIRLYDYMNIPIYREKTFANLSSFVYNFKLDHLDPEDKAENRRFIFSYENGRLFRLAAVGNEVRRKEYMYVHFLKRDMTVETADDEDRYLVIPNRLISIPETGLGGRRPVHQTRRCAAHPALLRKAFSGECA